MSETDQLIKLVEALQEKDRLANGGDFTIDFPNSDLELFQEPGLTAQFLEAAAEHVGLEVVLKGSDSARLRHKRARMTRMYTMPID